MSKCNMFSGVLALAFALALSSPAAALADETASVGQATEPQQVDTQGKAPEATEPVENDKTMSASEVFTAIEGLGGDVAQSMAKVIQTVFEGSGKPTAVIVGSEWQGAFFVGYRKGTGKVIFKGQDPETAPEIFWRAPSIGLNVGGSASKVAILVYGATTPKQLQQTFASIQGSYHVVVGAGVSYLRSNLDLDDKNAIGLAYVTVGVGLDAGVAVESLSFSKSERWLPELFK